MQKAYSFYNVRRPFRRILYLQMIPQYQRCRGGPESRNVIFRSGPECRGKAVVVYREKVDFGNGNVLESMKGKQYRRTRTMESVLR